MVNPNDLMIRNIANNEYTLQIRELIATQSTEDSPLIMRGPGEITFDAKGRLNLSCHLTKSDEIKAHELNWSGEPGIITPDDEYFDIEIHDYSGVTWKAKQTYIQQTLTLMGSEPGYCTGELRKISSSKETASTNQFFQLFFPKNQSFIGELKTKISEDSKHVKTSTIKTKNLNIEIAEHLSHLGITVTSEKNLTRKTTDSVISALSITFGVELTPFLTISQYGGKYKKEILQHKKTAETNLLTPIFQPRINTKETLILIEKLIDFIDNNDTPIYRLWYKNHQAFQAGLDVFSLSICTTIESLINIHLTKYKSPEKNLQSLHITPYQKLNH